MSSIETVRSLDWLSDPYTDWAQRYPGHQAAGYFCSYVPIEILHAAGFAPVRILQLSGSVALADAHWPSFSCATARAALTGLLSHQLGFLSVVVFSHTCDTMQCLADVWRMVEPGQAVVNFSLPTALDAAGALEYVRDAHRELLTGLESLCNRSVSEHTLRSSVALFNEQRHLMAELYRARDRVRARKLWQMTMASLLMPVEETLQELKRTIASLPGTPPSGRQGPRLVVSGTTLYDGGILELIEDLGGEVVGDNLCTGERAFSGSVDLEHHTDVIEALAARVMERTLCPVKHKKGEDSAASILDLVRSRLAAGVVFLQPKYCDPCAFEYVPQRIALEKAGVPHITVEVETGAPTAQMRTRLQALLEMLS